MIMCKRAHACVHVRTRVCLCVCLCGGIIIIIIIIKLAITIGNFVVLGTLKNLFMGPDIFVDE